MSALSNFQNGQSFPSISTAMLGTIAQGLNKTDSQAVGGPPPTPRVLESIGRLGCNPAKGCAGQSAARS
jgi:hypothetical protein